MPSLQSSEVHIETEQYLKAIGSHEEASFYIRDSLAKRVANMSR